MANKRVSKVVLLEIAAESMQLLGKFDRHINSVEQAFAVKIIPQGLNIIIEGPEKEATPVWELFQQLLVFIRKGHRISSSEFEYALKLARAGEAGQVKGLFNGLVLVTPRGKQIRPKTAGQKSYLEAIRCNDIVIGIGPAGTGK
ncbi:MAG TPA: phosphate starvation-inducible protein PhoH, partial [Firmicutes bacterium]|nr:phosphate starvation-inducible protein PhoH [Bacillota bacterium]